MTHSRHARGMGIGGFVLGLLLFPPGTVIAAGSDDETLVPPVKMQRIWDGGKHNAFTSLWRFRDAWFCGLREGTGHAGDKGVVRVIRSATGDEWKSAARLEHELYDLRDPKFSQMPDGRLMIVGGAVDIRKTPGIRFRELRTFVSFSIDGVEWSPPQIVLGPWEWLWRITWRDGVGYGVAYHVGHGGSTPRETRYGTLYRTKDGLKYEPVHRFETPDGAGETTLRFEADGTMRMVMRRDGAQRRGLLGTAKAPYTNWKLVDTPYHFGGPDLTQSPAGTWLVGTRTTEGGKTTLATVNFDTGTISPLWTLDGKGDCSYPGFVWHEKFLWMSFYSSHEGKTNIYLARFKLGPAS